MTSCSAFATVRTLVTICPHHKVTVLQKKKNFKHKWILSVFSLNCKTYHSIHRYSNFFLTTNLTLLVHTHSREYIREYMEVRISWLSCHPSFLRLHLAVHAVPTIAQLITPNQKRFAIFLSFFSFKLCLIQQKSTEIGSDYLNNLLMPKVLKGLSQRFLVGE